MANQNTVQSLRHSGVKVRVVHYRRLRVSGDANGKLVQRNQFGANRPFPSTYIDSKGGRTEVEITLADGKTVRGVAECSKKDSFNRRDGLQLAITRALAQA